MFMAMLNVSLHIYFQKQVFVKKPLRYVVLSSLPLWPFQLWSYSWRETITAPMTEVEKEDEVKKNSQQLKRTLGELPRKVHGVVSFTYHIGTEKGWESVWLEEYGDFAFHTSSKIFDCIIIEEGSFYVFDIEERDSTEDSTEVGIYGPVAWITDGQKSNI